MIYISFFSIICIFVIENQLIMRKLLICLAVATTLLSTSCSGDDSDNSVDQPIETGRLRISALPTNMEFTHYRINYQKLKEVNGVETTFQTTLKGDNSNITCDINLDEHYEEGVPNYIEIKRIGTVLPTNYEVGIWLIEPDLEFFVEDDFTNATEFWLLKIEVNKVGGNYTFTKL